MTDRARIRIAAAVTALFLAGISAAGLATRDHRPPPATTAATRAVTAPARTATTDDSATARAGGDGDRYEAEGYEEIEDDE